MKTLETKRIILRNFKQTDLNDFYEYASVEGVGENAGWPHHTDISVTQKILDSFIEKDEVYAVVLKEKDKVIGSLGLHHHSFDPEAYPDPEVQRELGYVIGKPYWGLGLMTEAVSAAITYAFEELKLEVLWCGHFVENGRSGRVIDKSGFRFYKESVYEAKQLNKTFDDLKYIMTREDYEASLQRERQMTDIHVRLEEERDYHASEEVAKAAFSYPARIERSMIGCCLEHYMVHSLREKDGIKELSFVAEIGDKIVGHVIYSSAYVEQPDGSRVDVLNFGPLSVQPEYQRLGVGKALMNYSIEQAKKMGYGAILFFGRSKYYPQFGFKQAVEFGITTCDGDNFPAFMGMELKPGFLKNVTGRYYEAPIYDDDLNREQAKKYDEMYFR